MLSLRMFGGAVLEGVDGPLSGAATQRRRLAILALLASHPGGISRDRLIAYFWPENAEERARHALAQLLYAIRKDLGDDAVTGSGTMLRLEPGRLATDIHEFNTALAAGDLERASELYVGPFMDGFYLSGCPEFERWVDQERARLAQRVVSAVETLARRAADAGDQGKAVVWWTRLATLEPVDSRIALSLVKAMVAAGDATGAMRAARTHELLVADSLGVGPDASISDFMSALAAATPPADRDSSERRFNGATPTLQTASDAVLAAAVADEAPGAQGIDHRAADIDQDVGTAVRGRWRPGRRVILTATLAIAVGVLAGWMLFSSRGPLAGRDSANRAWLLIADVENDTDDPSFDRTLPLILVAGLRQSRRIYVMPPERVRQALLRARKTGDAALLDAPLARELALRDGVGLVAVPAVSRAGSGFELSIRVLDPGTGGVLAAEARYTPDREGVIEAIGAMVRSLRRGLGEPMLSVAARSVPLPRVTTASFEALDRFANGAEAFNGARMDEALSLYNEAVTLDSTFATAHAALGGLLYYINRPTEAESHFARALSHMEGLPGRERVLLHARIADWRGDREAAITLLRGQLAQDPDDLDALYRLGYNQMRLGHSRQAVEVFRQIVSLDSLDHTAFINLATAEKRLGLYDEALQSYARAFALRPELATADNNVNLEFAGTYVMAGHPDSAVLRIAPMLEGDRDTRSRGLRSMAFIAMFRGQYAIAGGQLNEAILLNRAGGAWVSEMRNRLLLGSALRLVGRSAEARIQVDSAFTIASRIDTDPILLFWIGQALARTGDARRADTLLSTIDRNRHPDNVPGRAASEGLRGEILVADGTAVDAIAHLELAMRLDSTRLTLEALANAVAAAGQDDRAVQLYTELGRGTEFGWEGQEHWRLAPYHLGCVEERRGRITAAAEAYRWFLDGWTGADSDLFPVAVARARLAGFGLTAEDAAAAQTLEKSVSACVSPFAPVTTR